MKSPKICHVHQCEMNVINKYEKYYYSLQNIVFPLKGASNQGIQFLFLNFFFSLSLSLQIPLSNLSVQIHTLSKAWSRWVYIHSDCWRR